MADPLSVMAAVLAVVTASVQSVKTLHATVLRYRGRDKTLKRLGDELEGMSNMLESLEQVVQVEQSIPELLQGPTKRCREICQQFERCMISFRQNAKPGLVDWAKMEFKQGDINEFIDTISWYKSTISIGIGIVTIQAVKVSQEALQEYHEMIQDTMYNLNVRLQRVDEKLETQSHPNLAAPSIDLNDEKEVTKVCLQICENAKHFLESLKQDPVILQTVQRATEEEEEGREEKEEEQRNGFEAQQLTLQAIDENEDKFVQISNVLRNRLETLITRNDPADGEAKSRLLEDISSYKQCLEVCKIADDVSSRKIYRVGEAVAHGNSDQVVVTTLADLFDVKKAISRDQSAQLIGSMAPEELRYVAEKRYGSRFGALVSEPSHAAGTGSSANAASEKRSSRKEGGLFSFKTRTDGEKPSSNQVKKRLGQEEH